MKVSVMGKVRETYSKYDGGACGYRVLPKAGCKYSCKMVGDLSFSTLLKEFKGKLIKITVEEVSKEEYYEVPKGFLNPKRVTISRDKVIYMNEVNVYYYDENNCVMWARKKKTISRGNTTCVESSRPLYVVKKTIKKVDFEKVFRGNNDKLIEKFKSIGLPNRQKGEV